MHLKEILGEGLDSHWLLQSKRSAETISVSSVVRFPNGSLHVIISFRQDIVCHDNKAGFVTIVHGDPYGRLILSNVMGPEMNPPNLFRFCHPDHRHPVRPIILASKYLQLLKLLTSSL